jgi:hypothetical protein
MTRRAQSSKRRWIARAKAGKWVPKEVVFVLDRDQDWFERWEPHPTERGFMRLRGSTPATPAEGQKDQ